MPNVWVRPPGGCTLRNRQTYATRFRVGNAEQAAGVEEEIRWAIEHASPIVRELVRLDVLLYQLDAALRR